MGRPEIEIPAEQVLKLAARGAKTTEIADFFGCSPDTIERRFAGELAKGRATKNIKLRDLQWKAAEKLNPSILIFLGRVELGQVEAQDSADASQPIQIAYIPKSKRTGTE